MDYAQQIQPIVKMVCENYPSYAKASEATGVSSAYLSRVNNGDLKPKNVKHSTVQKLMSGLSNHQAEQIRSSGKDIVYEKKLSDTQMHKWLKSLNQNQREALITIIDMIPRS